MKAHTLFRLTEKIVSTPHMMEASAFDRAVAFLEDRNNGILEMALTNEAMRYEREVVYNPDTKVGIVSLQGPLTYLHYQPMCGETPTSYQGLVADFDTLLEKGAKTIVLDTDSPGGEAYAVFETAKRLRQMADEHEAKIITYVDGMAASAAYALASMSDEIIMNPSAEVGSIGVVVRLRNANKAMKNMGVEDTYVYAGKSKIPFNAEGEFAEEFLTDLQEKVNVLYGEFVSHVAQMRGIDEADVKNTEAKTFLADKAIQLHLVDKVMEVEEFYTYLSTVANGEHQPMLTTRFSKKGDSAKMQEFETLKEAHSVLEASFAEQATELAAIKEAFAAKEAAYADVVAQLDQFKAAAEEAQQAAEAARLEAEAQAKQAKADARKAALSAVVAESEVEALMASLESLEDAAFETVVASLGVKAKALDESNLFKEMGVGDKGDADALSETAKLLQARYKNQ